ncbi:MAG: hypothetical protein HOH66_18060 [Rhodospirillaceae bacterium]|jgi:hypothetical protein|nr:hypothetical protein [Rhodospirillaceae bacterium]
MFGIGFKELLLLIGVLLVVWYGARVLRRFEDHRGRRAAMHDKRRATKARSRAEPAPKAEEPGVEEMAECPACGVYHATGTQPRCERGDCPLRAGA